MSLLCVLLVLAACGGAQADGSQEQFQIRKPKATFTPTTIGASAAELSAPQPAAQETGNTDNGSLNESAPADVSGSASNESTENGGTANNDSASQESTSAETSPAASRTVTGQGVINFALVNGRSGPSTDFGIVGVVAINETFDVLGQNEAEDWWQLCCYLDQEFWVIDEYVDVQLSSGAVAVDNTQSNPAPAQPAPAQPAPAVAPAAVAPTATPVPPAPEAPAPEAPSPEEPTGDLTFDLVVQEQFSEESVVRIFLYVFNDQVQALEGYSIRVTKDGNELPVGSKSYGPQAGYTWPVSTARQRFENMKVEFPGEAPNGTWVIELIDGSGTVVGPPATFELPRSEPNQELYVRYKQK